MKNKKGFTLVELLVVIGILGVLIAIAVPSSIGIANRIKAKMYESKVKTIEVAAGLWAEDHKSDCISQYNTLTVGELVSGKYLKADKKDNGQKIITNPNPTEEIPNEDLNDYTLKDLHIDLDMVCTNSEIASQKIIEDNNGILKSETETPDFSSSSSPSGLYQTEDLDGISYYFHRSTTNNNLKFANKDWKILRINGDGSIRLILNERIDTEVVKYSEIDSHLDSWFAANLASYENFLTLGRYCKDTDLESYSGNMGSFTYAYRRYQDKKPDLSCKSPYKEKIGIPNIDEIMVYGINYLTYDDYIIWTASYSFSGFGKDYVMTIPVDSNYMKIDTELSYGDQVYIVPIITLKADIAISGSGTVSDPYVVK